MLLKKAPVRCCVVLSHKIFIAIIGPECVHNNLKGKESTAARSVYLSPRRAKWLKSCGASESTDVLMLKQQPPGKLWIIRQSRSNLTNL